MLEGKIIQLKNDNNYIGIIENISSSNRICIRYIRSNQPPSHGQTSYDLEEFKKHWKILT